MKRLIALAVCFVIAPAAAAPKARSIPECRFFWDVAITARAIALEGVAAQPALNILGRLYETRGEKRVAGIIDAINRAAQVKHPRSAGEFAAAVQDACVENRGDMDAVIGVDT